MDKIKQYFNLVLRKMQVFGGRFAKVKKVKTKPQVRMVSQKTANLVFYFGLGLLVFIGFVSMLRSITLGGSVSNLENKVGRFTETFAKVSSNQLGVDIPKVQQYMSGFMEVYVNYDLEYADERLTELGDYFAFDMVSFNEAIKEKRELLGQELIGLESDDSYLLAKVKVDYKSGEGDKQVEKTVIIAVPFRFEKKRLSIVSPPYFLDSENLLGRSDGLEQKKITEVDRLDEKTTESISKFLPVFFGKYALSNRGDLKLLMKKPDLMGKGYKVARVNDSAAMYYKKGGKKAVQVSVEFEEEGTGALHTEYFTLYLTKQKSGWFVSELYHYYK